jgi:hypothetical protein
LAVTHVCGYEHPSQFTAQDIEFAAGPATFKTLEDLFGYSPNRQWNGIPGWGKQKTVLELLKSA